MPENVPKNYYFIEGEVSPLILEWQKYYQKESDLKEIRKELEEVNDPSLIGQIKNLNIQIEETRKDASPIIDKIMRESIKVIRGVIFRAQFHKRETYDTCLEIATEACLKSLPRFDPEIGTAFNYISLTAKKSIIFYLIKKSKRKTLSLDYEYSSENNLTLENLLQQEEKTLKNLEIENFIDSIYNLIDELNEKKSLTSVTKELKDYLFYAQGKYEKKDFFNWARSNGISSNLLRKFIKFLKENKETLYKEVGVT